jgi:hypothetical protein
MLIYPGVGEPFAFDYRLAGFPVRIRSVDLDRAWEEIQAQMLALLAPRGAVR